ncbi:speedy protein A [Cephus cinctus]|uniref:Speedy protein A n=1 Tax=Cephus cinctus TaxID=211228 RepID=A0AAJ7BQF2_CEPCN|nr:speedy protein A [Cephus cinctus]
MGNSMEQRIIPSEHQSCRHRMICIKQWNIDYFFKLIDQDLEDFFVTDPCCKLADNYLIAMVFTYFLRASLYPEEYTTFNFFVALYLAHDMEEDEDNVKPELQAWARAAHYQNISLNSLLQHRDNLFRRMEHRGAVSRLCCDIVMRSLKPEHKVWHRQRHSNHSGAASDFNRKRDTCPKCTRNRFSQSSTSSSECSPEAVHIMKPRRTILNNGAVKKIRTESYDSMRKKMGKVKISFTVKEIQEASRGESH